MKNVRNLLMSLTGEDILLGDKICINLVGVFIYCYLSKRTGLSAHQSAEKRAPGTPTYGKIVLVESYLAGERCLQTLPKKSLKTSRTL
jgi:hypothetical protein